MRTIKVFAAVLLALALCLSGMAAADEDEYAAITGAWYSEEIMMTVTEEGRFVLGWNDGDWEGVLESEWRTNADDEEYLAYRMTLDDPTLSRWQTLELVWEITRPGRLTLYEDGSPAEVFYDAPICVTEIAGDDLSGYEPYAYVDSAQGREPVVTMVFTFLRPVRDVAVMRMYDQEIDEEGNLGYNGTTLQWWERLDAGQRIVVTHVFEGDLPDLSVNFVAEDETGYDFAVQLSGEDGELILLPMQAAEG